jgi:hypothetical protein
MKTQNGSTSKSVGLTRYEVMKMITSREVNMVEGDDMVEETNNSFVGNDEHEEVEEPFLTNVYTTEVSFIELAIINAYLYSVYVGKQDGIIVKNYGTTDSLGFIDFSGIFNPIESYWFSSKFIDNDIEFFIQTKIYVDNRDVLNCQLHLTSKTNFEYNELIEFSKKIKKIAFNNSEYKGKCIKVKLKDGMFKGIEVINLVESGNTLVLNDVQKKYIDHFVSRVGRGGNARYLLNGNPGTGKAQPLDAKILTPNGWITMGEIKVGDEVLTPLGKTTKVIGVFPQGKKEIYEVETVDGKKAECCSEHLWKVFGIKKGVRQDWSILNTDSIKYALENTRTKIMLPLISTNVAKSIGKEKEFVIEPYVMGYLLGGGSFGKESLKVYTGYDDEIIYRLSTLIGDGYKIIADKKYGNYSITTIDDNLLVREINELGLSDTSSDTKFIPEKYKNGSLDQKSSLIQGIMDSDGNIDERSRLAYSTTSKKLATDIQELIWSIGGICKIKEKYGKLKYKGVKKLGKLTYNLKIKFHSPNELFWLARKKNKITSTHQSNYIKNKIKSINFVGLKEAKCIMVDDSEHLYITNDYIVTHNTESIRDIARRLTPDVTFIIPDFNNSDDLTTIMEACEIFENGVIIMDDIDLYLGSRDNGSYTRLLGQFLSFFDGVKKRKISLLASTNDKGLVDKAAERPGRFNLTLDFSYLDKEQIIKVCDIHLPELWRVKEVYSALSGTVSGKKANITGAFIANLGDNIREMSEDEPNWTLEDTISLITESYKGFYMSQTSKDKESVGFKNV